MKHLLRRVFYRRGSQNDRVTTNVINFWAYRQARERGFTFGDH